MDAWQELIMAEVKDMRSEMRSGFKRLDQKIDSETQKLESDMAPVKSHVAVVEWTGIVLSALISSGIVGTLFSIFK